MEGLILLRYCFAKASVDCYGGQGDGGGLETRNLKLETRGKESGVWILLRRIHPSSAAADYGELRLRRMGGGEEGYRHLCPVGSGASPLFVTCLVWMMVVRNQDALEVPIPIVLLRDLGKFRIYRRCQSGCGSSFCAGAWSTWGGGALWALSDPANWPICERYCRCGPAR